MIDFLKESTFAVNDVIRTAWDILKKEYLSIAGIGLMMFVTWNLSSFMALYFGEINIGVNLFMAFIFILLYVGLQLTLFKYILKILDENDVNVTVRNSLPSRKQVLFFLLGTLYFIICIVLVYLLIGILLLPFVYTGISVNIIAQIAISTGIIGMLITWVRISFFPFFIIDRNTWPFQSIRFSLAITRGNFTKLLLLLIFFAIFHLLSLYLNYAGYPIISALVSIVNSFLIVPLSSVAIAVAYRKMMNEYVGDADPDIIHNLI
jgi:hypothetical protein